jgi:hemerythrin-like domain-containing protein
VAHVCSEVYHCFPRIYGSDRGSLMLRSLSRDYPAFAAQLRDQHRNVERVLTFIRIQADLPRIQIDLRLLDNAVAYMEGFPTHVHEPSEDLVSERLLVRMPNSAGLLERLTKQRQEFMRMESGLRRDIHRVQDGESDAYHEMREAALLYCYKCAAHIYVEETELFSRAENVLQEEDWRQIRQEQARRFAQPIYPELKSQDSLYDFLMSEEGSDLLRGQQR